MPDADDDARRRRIRAGGQRGAQIDRLGIAVPGSVCASSARIAAMRRGDGPNALSFAPSAGASRDADAAREFFGRDERPRRREPRRRARRRASALMRAPFSDGDAARAEGDTWTGSPASMRAASVADDDVAVARASRLTCAERSAERRGESGRPIGRTCTGTYHVQPARPANGSRASAVQLARPARSRRCSAATIGRTTASRIISADVGLPGQADHGFAVRPRRASSACRASRAGRGR